MAGDGDMTVEAHETRWWAEWRAANYGWEGLARKPILGGGLHGEATLQDYWRRDPISGVLRADAALKKAGELVELDGRWWHVVHLPLRGAGGVTWKADPEHVAWTLLADLVAARVLAGRETGGRFAVPSWRPDGPDGRARLDGGVLGGALNHPDLAGHPIHLSCEDAWIERWNGGGCEYGSGAAFQRAVFSGDTRVYGATFSGDARFDGAIFAGEASFDGARFSGDASFYRATFLGHASFYRAIFSGLSGFFYTAFFADASFDNAALSGAARFDNARFSGEARFDNANFQGGARFDEVTFSGDASFHRTVFADDTGFGGAKFAGVVGFDAASFDKRLVVWAKGLSFGPQARVSFRHAVFKGPVQFSATIAEPERSFAGTFYAARFLDIADFSGAVGPRQAGRLAAAFGESQFEKALILTDGSDRKARAYFREKILAGALGEHDAARDERLAQLEAGCRTIKIAMGKARDELREQRYYRFQLRARQHRSDIDRWERSFGALYGLVSDFGSSFSRPLIALAALTVAFGLIYWLWAAWLDVAGGGGFWHGQSLALAGVFRPFALLAPEAIAKTKAPWSSILLAVNPAVALGVRLVTTLQSVLSGILIFLFALAVKRRFQIS